MDWAREAPWRLLWAMAAVALAALAAVPFHRFDPERMPRRSAAERPEARKGTRSLRRRWTPLFERLVGRWRGLTVLWAEFSLLVRDRRRGWALVALGLWMACLFAPLDVVQRFLLPAAWMWPLAAWAEMGSHEARHRTEALVFVCPRPLRRQLPAAYAAGVLLAAAVGSGAALRFIAAHAWAQLLTWAVGALFVPALALAAGVVSRGTRLFEVTYFLVWYLGPLNGAPPFNFLAPTLAAAGGFLLATLVLLLVATAARARRLRA